MDNPSAATAIASGFDALAKNEYPTARAAFEQALNKGGGDDALVHLGWLLEQGLGGEKDIPRAMKLYRMGLETESADLAAYHLGLLLMKRGDQREGAGFLQRSADSGNPSAAYWLYAYCSESNDIESLALADQSLLRAAELGHAYALRDIARRRMRTNKDLRGKLAARLAYWKAKLVGMALTIRNAHDWRVR
ncbi:hypothetical protein [Massilia sp. DWR3-1-1]|uniref:hypothetical protein n=1 Tax=Massilia sp. DWR3-1-1 TaxID=2804559 RepID=UPI003CF2A75F